jgi:hypothetical protein
MCRTDSHSKYYGHSDRVCDGLRLHFVSSTRIHSPKANAYLCSALAGTPIAGALASKYGWLSVSIYTGVSLLAAAAVLAIARFKQDRKLLAIV